MGPHHVHGQQYRRQDRLPSRRQAPHSCHSRARRKKVSSFLGVEYSILIIVTFFSHFDQLVTGKPPTNPRYSLGSRKYHEKYC